MNEINISKNNLINHSKKYQRCINSTIENQFNNIENYYKDLQEAISKDKKIFFCGNGGSFADSQHIVGELVVRIKKNRKPFDCIALGTNQTISTAISNDFSYENIFSREIEAYAKEKDILVCLSTSGTSKNILKVLSKAKEIGLVTWLITGKKSNKKPYIAQNHIYINSDNTPLIQEIYMHINHYVCEKLEEQYIK